MVTIRGVLGHFVHVTPEVKEASMAGTPKGGRLAAQRNKAKHGADFYARIGRMGGQASKSGGFAAGEEGRKRASYYGAIGGSISRRS